MGSFAERLKRLRTAVGMSQSALADDAAVTKSYVAKLEQGTSTPSGIALIQQLSRALAVNPALLFGENPTGPVDHSRLPESGEPAIAFLDRNLDIKFANSVWEQLLPGAEPGTSLLIWLFKNTRSRIVVENWHDLAHAAAWWSAAFATASDAIRLAQKVPQYQRYVDAPYSPDAQRALLQPGAIEIREWGTSHINRWTLDAYQGLTHSAFALTLTLYTEE